MSARAVWLAAAWLVLAGSGACAPRESGSWNPRAAASFLDRREAWWSTWSVAGRDHGTFCVSCHTALAYALARPALRGVLAEPQLTTAELRLLRNVSERVRLDSSAAPYYPKRAVTARGTEAVLNALILANADSRGGHPSKEGRAAFAQLWAQQETSGEDAGSWPWIQFNNEPWEADDSRFYGAVLGALAIGLAPEAERAQPQFQQGLERLRGYLERRYSVQSPINRVALLWASARLPQLMDAERRQSLIAEVWTRQRSDGGWSLASMVGPWQRKDETALPVRSDGYASGLAVLALEGAGVSSADPRLARALAWLKTQQSIWNGAWTGDSLNRQRNRLLDDAGQFMDDAATAYAVLALTNDAGAGLGSGAR